MAEADDGRAPVGRAIADRGLHMTSVPALLFLTLFLVYVVTTTRTFMHVDAHAASVEAWHIGTTGSPWLEGSLTSVMTSNPFIGEASNGHMVALRMPGPVLLGIPFYTTAGLLGVEGFDPLPGGVAAAAMTAGTALCLFLALRTLMPGPASMIVTLVFALATPTWTVSADQLWTHTLTQFAIAASAWGLSTGRHWLIGFALGLGMLGRPHLAVIAAVVGLALAWHHRRMRPMVAVGLPSVGSLLVLAAWNNWMFGSWGIEGAYAGKTQAAVSGFSPTTDTVEGPTQLTNVLGFLVSFDRGLLIWTPIVLLLIPALVRSWPGMPAWTKWLFLGGILYTVVQLRLNEFHGGQTFWGYRLGLEFITCALPAYALAWRYAGRVARRLRVPVLGMQLGAMVVGASTYRGFVHIDRVWRDNSLFALAREEPVVVGLVLVCSVATAVAGARYLERVTATASPYASADVHTEEV